MLGRIPQETIHVNGPCVITLLSVNGNKCRIGIEADRDRVQVLRGEIVQKYAVDPTEPTPAETQLQPDQVADDEFSESGIFSNDDAE